MTAAVEFLHVGVDFPTVHVPSLKEWAIRQVRRRHHQVYFEALRDVSFAVEPGRCLGIIGGNGAGKSTLLRVAAGVITPSHGEAIVRGTVAPLIELGTGFDAELTGRENIFFNASLLGRSRASVRARLDEIIEFSGLEAFIDAPLRTYSTGMVARLAFSIATTVDADLILLDEILAVGDAAFQQRCEERILSFFRSGCTIVLVSHDLASVRRLCTEVLWLHDGRIRAIGSDDFVIDAYEQEAGPSTISIPQREEMPPLSQASQPSVRNESSPTIPSRRSQLPDVGLIIPAGSDRRVVSTLLEQRLHELYEVTLTLRGDTMEWMPAEPEFVLVITDPQLVPSKRLIEKLRSALTENPECFAAVPVTNVSSVQEQIVTAGRPYWTMRQFDEVTEWFGRKPQMFRSLRWGEGDPGAFMARAAAFIRPSSMERVAELLRSQAVVIDTTAYVHRFPWIYSLARPDLVERIGADSQALLDVFCGDGSLGAAIKNARNCRVVGIEPEKDAAAEARRRLDLLLEGSLSSVLGQLEESFDTIVIGERFAGEPEPVAALVALRRLCRPGGRLILSLHNVAAWPVAADLLLGRFDYAYVANVHASALRFFTRNSVERMLETAGWQVVSVEPRLQEQTSESRRLFHALDLASIPHSREALLASAFYVSATTSSS